MEFPKKLSTDDMRLFLKEAILTGYRVGAYAVGLGEGDYPASSLDQALCLYVFETSFSPDAVYVRESLTDHWWVQGEIEFNIAEDTHIDLSS